MLEGKWIRPETDMRDVCPVFRRTWNRKGKMKRAELLLTAQGVYEAVLNGKKVGNGVLAPGWTSYRKRRACAGVDQLPETAAVPDL